MHINKNGVDLGFLSLLGWRFCHKSWRLLHFYCCLEDLRLRCCRSTFPWGGRLVLLSLLFYYYFFVCFNNGNWFMKMLFLLLLLIYCHFERTFWWKLVPCSCQSTFSFCLVWIWCSFCRKIFFEQTVVNFCCIFVLL